MLGTSPPSPPVHSVMTSCLPLVRLHHALTPPPSFLLCLKWGAFTKTSCSPYPRLGAGEGVFKTQEVGWSLLADDGGGGVCTLEADEIFWGQSPEWCIVP